MSGKPVTGQQIVDSIASSPTTRLDLNDGTIWRCNDFDAPPPRLRRAMSQNAMRDGVFVSSSQYEARRIVARFQIFKASRDLAAVQLQLLARELDRTDNYLKLQHDGASKPVFFKLFRSDMSAIRDIPGQLSAYECEVEFLAEPFALGLREDLGPFTVPNDPAETSGLYFDVTGVIGDVSAPCVLVNTGDHRGGGWLGVRQHGTPSDMSWWFVQAEDCVTNGLDTSQAAGGPDATMSGTETNNYMVTDYSVASTLSTRLRIIDTSLTDAQAAALTGTYRIFAVVRRSDNTSVITIRCATAGATGSTVTLPMSTSRQMVNLGLFSFEPPTPAVGRLNSSPLGRDQIEINFASGRTSGAGSLQWDYFVLLPCDAASLAMTGPTALFGDELVIDGPSDAVYYTEDGADPLGAGARSTGSAEAVSGGFPSLVPNQTNRFIYLAGDLSSSPVTQDVTDEAEFTAYYWPRYLYIRPSAS